MSLGRRWSAMWIVLVSTLICPLVGILAGSTMYVASAAGAGAGWDAVRAAPMVLLLSVPIATPFGIVTGLIAALLIVGLGSGTLRNASLGRWSRIGVASGAGLGSVCPAFLMLAGWGPVSVGWIIFNLMLGATAGAVAGALLSLFGWREYGR